MHRGYIKLWRKLQDNPLWKEPRKFSKAEAWIDIIMEVQHDPNPQQVIIGNTVLICNRSESLKSLDTWAKRWNWDKSATRRFFNLLKKSGNIDTANDTVTTRISVINYDTYCPLRNADETQTKRKRNASETQVTPDNNVNNVNNTYSSDFLTFWDAYPNRKGKGAAYKSFQSAKKNGNLADMLEAIKRQSKSEQWKKNNGQYIPHPSTWLNQKRWEDDVDVVIEQEDDFYKKLGS